MKPEAPHAPPLCSDCAWTDICREDEICTRARLATIGFDAGTPIAAARRLAAAAPPSAIVEPPTQAELAGRGAPRRRFALEFDPRPRTNGIELARLARTRIRAAIDEISKAQTQIAPGIGAGYSPDPEMAAAERTAVRVLEALPETVAAAFGLEIRAACAGCGTALFKDEPYMSDARGAPVCETCNDGADPGGLSERHGA